MTKTYIWAMAVIAAFVAGTIMTGSLVMAEKPEKDADEDGVME